MHVFHNQLLLELSLDPFNTLHMSLVTRKPVLGVCDQGKLKPVCAATEASKRLEILDMETRDIILSRQRTTNALIRLRGLICAYCCSHRANTGFLMTRIIYITDLLKMCLKKFNAENQKDF